MYSLKNHLRSTAPPHMNHDRSFVIEEADHDAYLAGINEEGAKHQGITRHEHHTNFNPITFETSEESENPSTSLLDIIENLPTAVKSGLGPLMLIRRSVSIRGWVSYFYEISTNSTGAMATTTSREEHAERHTVVSTSTTTEVEMKQQGGAHQSNQGQKRRRASTHSTRTSTEVVEYIEPQQRMEIDRFCGLQGKPRLEEWLAPLLTPSQLLVNNALSESRPPAGQAYPSGDRNERRAYVQGLAWLIQGLPHDLNASERNDLMRAMPGTLLDEMSHRTGGRRLGPSRRGATAPEDRSLIQRVVAAMVVRLVGPLQFLWAYLIMLLTLAAQMERKYKVTQLVVKHSGELGYTVGKRGVKLSGAIYKNGGARVGAVVTDAAAYVADGLVKGIGDGIREACLELREAEAR